ncbi:rod shape-determining protein MreD [Candidatus Pelagibacter sp.]|nr:rod shape-determining protein MreD [Candidatus Pelagibacter sp.]
MSNLRNNNIIRIFFEYFPMILLFVSVMNDLDFNDVGIKYFSFNFSYILIFYYTLKRKEALGYVSLFIAGLFNDVIVGLPMGISSLLFLLLCGFASYLRNITLRPNLVKDWLFFLFTLLIINSFSYIFLVFIFEYDIDHTNSIINTLFTFTFYIFFTYIFHFIENFFVGYRNAE